MSGTTCKGSVTRVVMVSSVACDISTSSPSSEESSISCVVNDVPKKSLVKNKIYIQYKYIVV